MSERAAPRSKEQRKVDALAKLAQPVTDVWVATASADGEAHLVPLSLAWDGDRVIIAVDGRSRTAQNLDRSRRARLAVGPERDVVMIDAVVVSAIAVDEAPAVLGEGYAAQADWDPREAPDGYFFVILAPERMQVWREADEIAGRTIMSRGHWLV